MKTPIDCISYFVKEPQWTTGGDDTQYFIEKDENTGEVTVVFAASNSKRDWLNNFKFWKKPYKNMDTTFFCHSGFLTCYKKVEDEIRNQVKALNPSSITITGFSYGGAMAVLCMENFWYEFIYLRENQTTDTSERAKMAVGLPSLRGKIQCITFGAPRVVGFWNWWKIKDRWEGTRLFKNGSDIVTCVPLVVMLYHHVAKQIHIGDQVRLWKYLLTGNYHNMTKDSGYSGVMNRIVK